MTTTQRQHQTVPARTSGINRSLRTALWMVAVIVGFYLLREHWSHIAGNWVYLLLLACPLMHLFHGHGGHGGHGGADELTSDPRKTNNME